LTVQLLAWLGERPRSYGETMEAWHSHCPRLTIWEDALADDLVRVRRRDGVSVVELTQRGAALATPVPREAEPGLA
jgi:hypothetical protein